MKPELNELAAFAVSAIQLRLHQLKIPIKYIKIRPIPIDHDSRDFTASNQVEIALDGTSAPTVYVVQIQSGPLNWLEVMENRPPRSVEEINRIITNIEEVLRSMYKELEAACNLEDKSWPSKPRQ